MNAIVEPNDTFSFANLVMTSPVSMAGGNHFIKYLLNDRPLYIQPPNCKIKQGFVKAGKRAYCDLMFTNENENFIRWMENLEAFSRKFIYTNRAKWFENDLEEHDIENSFASPLKIFKSGKYYIARVNIPSALGKTSLKVYDESENVVDSETLKENDNVATILEIQGVRCSPRMFQIDMEMKQLLILKPVDLFEKCILKPANHREPLEEPTPSVVVVPEKHPEVPTGEPTPSVVVVPEKHPEVPTGEPTPSVVVVPEKHPEVPTGEPIKEEPIKEEDTGYLEEFELQVDFIESDEKLFLKKRDDVYYKMYREALKKARLAKELALTSYLEAKHIKNTYMLTDLSDESDLDEDPYIEN
jgi:hypothetical protein